LKEFIAESKKVIIIALLAIVVDSHRITKTIAVTMEDIS
jgi:hypothetical protein